jgi:porin
MMPRIRVKNALRAAAVPLLGAATLLAPAPDVLADAAPATSSGILPLADYSGEYAKRSYLLGDFGGKRTEWAKQGFTFDIDYNQYFQAVTDGGRDRDSEYGGTIDVNINVDFDRMGLIPGGLLQMRAVSRYGNSVNGISGAAIPVNADATHPTTSSADDDVTLWLPVINYTQYLSKTFAIGFGKYDTYDSANEFAGGRGRSQWWNQNLNMPVSPALIIPYSVLGGVALFMPNPNLTITGMVATSTDTSNRSGFDNFDDGTFGLLSLTNKYQLSSLPGGVGLMYGYGWDGDFNEINGRLNFDSGQLKLSTEDSTWFAAADAWQYLWVEGGSSQPVDINNGRQDLQGVGVFSRVQFADKDTNPVDYILSAGVSAKGLIPGRDNDSMGLGYSYSKLQLGRFLTAIGIEDTSTAVELFYNIELTPAVHLNLDAQLTNSALPNIDTATILGASLQIRL